MKHISFGEVESILTIIAKTHIGVLFQASATQRTRIGKLGNDLKTPHGSSFGPT